MRGELPTIFWIPDERGHVAATDFGFMSTSTKKATAVSYMSHDAAEQNILWEVRPAAPTSEAFHYGADVSMLSQFHHETEVLFPPGTMLQVNERAGSTQAMQEVLKTTARFKKSADKSADKSAAASKIQAMFRGRRDRKMSPSSRQLPTILRVAALLCIFLIGRVLLHPSHVQSLCAYLALSPSATSDLILLSLGGLAALLYAMPMPDGRSDPAAVKPASQASVKFAGDAAGAKGEEGTPSLGAPAPRPGLLKRQKTTEIPIAERLGMKARHQLVQEMRAKLDVSEEQTWDEEGKALKEYLRVSVLPSFI